MPYADYEKQKAHARAYYLAHRPEQDANHKAWRKANPEWLSARDAEYRVTHREHLNEYAREYRRRKPDKNSEAARGWRLRNPEAASASWARHDARRRGAAGSHTAAEWRDKCALFANLCVYCGERDPLTRDHKVPLSRGGSDFIENIVPACLDCNLAKRARTALEFIG